ncbi:MAG: phosphoribosylanthranilate isomerase [Clostridia bacterium]|nr:phosphoribosylanthranilate isomerase [Clostridia bacterium]
MRRLRERRRAFRAVGVLVDPDREEVERVVAAADLDVVQLHGSETPAFCHLVREVTGRQVVRAVSLRHLDDLSALAAYEPVVDAFLLDAWAPDRRGGTGRTLPWRALAARLAAMSRPLGRPWWLAGGLTPENVGEAVATLRPDGVDVSSGVERSGRKDPERIRAFVAAARAAERAAATDAVTADAATTAAGTPAGATGADGGKGGAGR